MKRWAAIAFVGVSLSIEAEPIEGQTRDADIVLAGGRVMDPETGLDARRNVGIRADRIAEISPEPLSGSMVVDVSGLVVAPGFIDPHAHGQTNEAHRFQAHDGVTTALELESGRPFLREWLETKEGKTLINYGATMAQSALRWMAMEKYRDVAREARRIVETEGFDDPRLREVLGEGFSARYESLTSSELEAMAEGLSAELAAGALGIGVPVGYYPGATREEIFRVYELAAELEVPVYTHVRDPNLAAIQEAIANAAATGASVHIVHLNSMALGRIGVALDMVRSAQLHGLDITTELYPYTAGSTSLESTLFDEGWQEVWGIDYGDIQWEATGERLTSETFEKYRKEGGTVIIHMMKEEWIDLGLKAPFTMIGSDGMPYHPKAHPRSAGTYARVLGRYVRERKALDLMEALAKMTLMPARRLEGVAPMMRTKGRIQVGCDADITVFDPETVLDTATFESGLSESKGIEHVLVNGTFVVRDGDTVPNVFPGRAVLGKYRH
ncbi:MAG TPA: amidohydrolase family protein [Vicinamibacteria bacterium]|nr:amidohydrolase family protein [Vicinamibacteria bacterium]